MPATLPDPGRKPLSAATLERLRCQLRRYERLPRRHEGDTGAETRPVLIRRNHGPAH